MSFDLSCSVWPRSLLASVVWRRQYARSWLVPSLCPCYTLWLDTLPTGVMSSLAGLVISHIWLSFMIVGSLVVFLRCAALCLHSWCNIANLPRALCDPCSKVSFYTASIFDSMSFPSMIMFVVIISRTCLMSALLL